MALFKSAVALHDSVILRFPSLDDFFFNAHNFHQELIALVNDVIVLFLVEVEIGHGLFASMGSFLESVDLFDALVILVF